MALKNEKGVTLIEILLSIVVLTIVLISVMNFFPQMGFMNKQNTNKSQAVQLAKEIFVEWRYDHEVKNLFKTGSEMIEEVKGFKKMNFDDYYHFEGLREGFYVEIKIKKQSDLENLDLPLTPYQVHSTHIQIYDENDHILSEIYGYIEYHSGGAS